MNFQSMNKQRKFILAASITGIISVFLPWIDALLINYNGLHDWGILTFSCFILSGIIAFKGDQTMSLGKSMWMFMLILGGLSVCSLAVIYFKNNGLRSPFVQVFGYGFYIALLSSIGIIISAYIFRMPGETKTKSNTAS